MHDHTYLITRIPGTDLTFNIPSAIGTLVTCIITYFVVVFLTNNVKLRPTGRKQSFAEIVATLIRNLISDNVSWSKFGRSLWAMGLSLISFIAVANTIGVLIEVKIDNVLYVNSVTADPTFTFTLAATMILFTHYYGFKHKGAKHYFSTYTSNGVGLTPFKIIEEFVNILTLSMRLFGNIYAGEVLLVMLVGLGTAGIWYFLPGMIGLMIWKAFSLFIGFIQAYIFTTMVFIYLSHKVEDAH